MSLSQPALASASARGGYAWWYVEAHDTVEQRFGLTLIMFAGSVFSPHYADRLRRGEPATGLEHPAVNFALYERGASGRAAGLPSRQRLWVMNEYAPSALRVSERRYPRRRQAMLKEWRERAPDQAREPADRI